MPLPQSHLCIAVTGHRSNRISAEAHADLLRASVQVISHIKAEVARPLCVYSALAEGADRIVATAGLQLGVQLHTVLPFSQDEYEEDFDSPESKAEYRYLLQQAESIEMLEYSKQTDGNQGYVAVGDALINRADIIIGIWDGEPSRGAGGTADVIMKAITHNIPVVWLKPIVNSPIQLLNQQNFETSTNIDLHSQATSWKQELRQLMLE